MAVIHRDEERVGHVVVSLKVIEQKRFVPNKKIAKIVVYPIIEIKQEMTNKEYSWPTDELKEDIILDINNLDESIKKVEEKERELIERAKDQFKKIVEIIRRLGSLGFEIGGHHVFFPY